MVSNGASPVPIPIQKVASALYNDDNHQIEGCLHYDQNFELAEKYLKPFYKDFKIPDAGFFLWLKVMTTRKQPKCCGKNFLKSYAGKFYGKRCQWY